MAQFDSGWEEYSPSDPFYSLGHKDTYSPELEPSGLLLVSSLEGEPLITSPQGQHIRLSEIIDSIPFSAVGTFWDNYPVEFERRWFESQMEVLAEPVKIFKF